MRESPALAAAARAAPAMATAMLARSTHAAGERLHSRSPIHTNTGSSARMMSDDATLVSFSDSIQNRK